MNIIQKTMPFTEMPPADEMYQALCDRNSEFEGVFFVGVRTTGIFCRPTCPARKPKRENVSFYRSTADALSAGYRACKKCKPLEVFGAAPEWLDSLLQKVEDDPSKRWKDADLRELDVEPARVRRWFNTHHGMTFHGYLRVRRLASAMGQIQVGTSIAGAGFASGFDSVSGFRDAFKKWFGNSPSGIDATADPILVNRILTPLGPMVVAANGSELILLEFADRRMLETQIKTVRRIFKVPFAPGENEIIEQTKSELTDYFAGSRFTFDVPIAVRGTEFQESVWRRLMKIRVGQTNSYDQMAKSIGRAGAQRAVGRANGDNRLGIIIPCHRVVRSDGTLSGYGGGLWRKQWLLDHEAKHCGFANQRP